MIELFCYLLRLKRYKRKPVEVGVFRRGWAMHFQRKFQTEEGVARQPLLVSNWPFVQYQNIISALFGLVTKHACDRRTDRWTKLRQLIPRYSIAVRALKP